MFFVGEKEKKKKTCLEIGDTSIFLGKSNKVPVTGVLQRILETH